MVRFIVSSEVPCEVWLENSRFLVSSADKKMIEIENSSNFKLKFKCQNNFSSDCLADFVYKNGEYTSTCEFVDLVQYDLKNYHILLKQNFNAVLQKKVKKIYQSGVTYNFYQNGLVEVETESELKFSSKYNIMLSDAEVLELTNGYKVIKLFSGANCTSVVLNTDWFENLVFENSIVEQTENGFEVLVDMKDIAKHGIVKVFETTTDGLSLVDEYTVYLKGKPCNDISPYVLPLYFLQCIIAKDFKEAKNCLSEKLSQHASSEHLIQFFGDFKYAECTKKSDKKICCNLTTNQNNKNVVKKYCFEIEHNKISNIYPE